MNQHWKQLLSRSLQLNSRSPGIIPHNGAFMPSNLPPGLVEAVRRIVTPSDSTLQKKGGANLIRLVALANISYLFLLKKFGVKIRSLKSTSYNLQTLELLDSLSDLWVTAWDCLDWLCDRGYLGSLPSFHFYCLIQEDILILPCVGDEGLESRSITACMRNRHEENRALQSLENPFSPKSYGHTYRIVAAAIVSVNQNPDFDRNYFTLLVQARMRALTVIKSQKPILTDSEGREQLQGTRPKPKPGRPKKS